MTQLIRKADAEFGKALVEAAQNKVQNEFKDAVIAEMSSLIRAAERQEELAEALTKSAEALRRRLKAVEDGRFAFEGRRIKYLDEEDQNIIHSDSLEYMTRNVGGSAPRGF